MALGEMDDLRKVWKLYCAIELKWKGLSSVQ